MYLSYDDNQFHEIIANAMAARGRVREIYGSGSQRFRFEPAPYRFRETVTAHLAGLGFLNDETPLEALHQANSPADLTVDSSGQSTVSSSLYEIGDEFQLNYRRFLKEVVRGELFDFDFYFQSVPTFRCSIPGSPGYDWRPNYHTDIAIGHPPETINFWLPLTTCSGNNSLIYAEVEDSVKMWSEFDFNFEKFHQSLEIDDGLFGRCGEITKSFDAENGEGLLFDSRTMHLHQKNDTDRSRISFDFRIIPVQAMNELPVEFVGTGRRKARFVPGGYYFEKSVDQLECG